MYDDVCEELVLMLTDTLNTELRGVGPEDVLDQPRLEMLQHELTKQVNMTDLINLALNLWSIWL